MSAPNRAAEGGRNLSMTIKVTGAWISGGPAHWGRRPGDLRVHVYDYLHRSLIIVHNITHNSNKLERNQMSADGGQQNNAFEELTRL